MIYHGILNDKMIKNKWTKDRGEYSPLSELQLYQSKAGHLGRNALKLSATAEPIGAAAAPL